jgi:hypothetical protein
MNRSRIAKVLIRIFGALLLIIGAGDAIDVVVLSGGLLTPARALVDLGLSVLGVWCLRGATANLRRPPARPPA